MESKSFIYWLQGYFEISESDSLTDKQINIIQKHLDMVFKYDENPEFTFVHWFRGYFIDRTITSNEIAIIRKELNSVFQHEIDPTFGDAEMQKELDDIHNRFDGYEREYNNHVYNNDPKNPLVKC